MCFGGTKKQDMNVPVAPSPTPAPSPSELSPQTAETKRAKIDAMRFGMASTMKTGPGGVTGAGADLSIPQAQGTKKNLGS